MIESIKQQHRIPLFRMMGTQISATPNSWQSVIKMIVFGVILAGIFHWRQGITTVLVLGVVYGILLLITYTLHTVGHIISASSVDAPMDEHIFTASMQTNVYNDEGKTITRDMHFGRAIGGPLMNLSLAVVSFMLWAFIPGYAFLFFAIVNFIFGAGSMLPFKHFDGEIIFKVSKPPTE